ncbi:MAG TPA: AMP-binding protein, partial [Polyangiaceae bacterium]
MPLPTFPERFNLADYFLFERLREGRGSKVALRFGARAYTYDDVARRTRAFAAALEEADVRRGERVLIVLPDVPPFAWVFFGTLARGCVVAMANPDAPLEGIEYLIDYTRATAIVTVPRVAIALRDRMRTGVFGRDVRRVWCVLDVAAFSGA